MEAVDVELALVALAAMLSPTTLTFSVLALILGERPKRTGLLFLLGAFGAMACIGVAAAFVIGDVASSGEPATPKTWVAVVDVIAGLLLAYWVSRRLRRPRDPERAAAMIQQMSKVVSSTAAATLLAGAALANAGGFIPLALKDISETKPGAAEYIVLWLAFTAVSLLPLSVAIVMLALAPARTMPILAATKGWLERHGRAVAAGILLLLAASLLRAGVAGLAA